MTEEVLILGAGIAGLSLARTLVSGGRPVRLLDKGKKPGGRCASRRLQDTVFDYGPMFLHGSDPELLKSLHGLGPTHLGWPARVAGQGAPCQPGSLERGETRLAPEGGVNVWAQHLADGLPMSLGTEVTHLGLEDDRITVFAGKEQWSARTVVVTAPAPQTRRLLGGLPGRAIAAADYLLGLAPLVPCLSVALLYPAEAPDPGWDLHYPNDTSVLTLLADERSKRPSGRARAIVLQASPRWSMAHLDEPVEVWTAALHEAARPLHPALTLVPLAQHAHRWRYARVHGGPGLNAPILQPLPNGALLGLAGEAFDPKGGLEGAYRSGLKLGRRLLAGPEGTS
ncbi:MAG: FAD-dependent oxidoreductase [Deltaproteobacteria bacterium]|nr:FAD-dependent oxidoreductase [Deltaproteobacteria bacterium]